MTNQNNAAQAAEQDPLSDQFVNAVIRQHGYDSPEAVIAQLWQWIGLNGSENGVTLLMYEAHKALSKLRAPVSDIREGFELTYAADADDPACASDLSHFTNGWRACIMSQVRAPVADEQALQAWADRFPEISDMGRLRDAWNDALASVPVAGEAVYTLSVKGVFHNWKPTTAAFSIPDGEHQLFLRPATPQASETEGRRVTCQHHWVSGENQHVSGEVYVCTACRTIRMGPLASAADAAALSTAVDYRRMEDAPQACPAMPEIGSDLINDACWKFVAAMPHKLPGPIWNDLKPALHVAICHVLAARQQPAGDVAYLARLSAAPILARDSHGVSLLTDPPQDAWKARGVDDVIRAALSAQPEQS